MKYLSELLQIISKRQLQKSDFLETEHLEQADNLFFKFYFGLKKGKVKSDQDAALMLYGDKAINEKYRKLKSRFYNKLINNTLLLDPSSFKLPPSYLAEAQVRRNISLASLFRSVGAHANALRLCKKALLLAEKYNDHQGTLSSCSLLADLYIKQNSFKESALVSEKQRRALENISIELELINEHRILNQLLKFEYPILKTSLSDGPQQKYVANENSFSPLALKTYYQNKIIKHGLKGAFKEITTLCNIFFEKNRKEDLRTEDLYYFINWNFIAQSKTLQTNKLLEELSAHISNKRFNYHQKENLTLSLISHLLKQNEIEAAIRSFNMISPIFEHSIKISSSAKLEVYYYMLQYFRIKQNILTPINRTNKYATIDGMEELTRITIRSTDVHKVLKLQINLIELVSIRNRYLLTAKIEQIRKLQTSETLKLPKRASQLIKVLNHWERQDFSKLPVSVEKEFNILCESNFLNSQNLDTFEPVNYGDLIKLVFEAHSTAVPNLS